MTASPAKTLPTIKLILYAAPAFVIALPTIPVYIRLPVLYGVDVGVGLAMTGLVLLIARIFDTISDPILGVLSDRFGFRGCRRKPWIAAGIVIAGLGLHNILQPPSGADAGYLLLWSIILYLGWTMVAVPYAAWGAELSTDYHERSRITAWREGAALLGIIGAGALAAILAAKAFDDRDGLAILSWSAIGLGALLVPLLIIFVPDRPAGFVVRSQADHRHIWAGLLSLLRNGPFIRLLTAWFLNGLANGIPAALFFLYLEHGLGVDEQTRPLFILSYFVAAIVAIPIWLRLSRHYGKHRVWCWAMILASAAFICVPAIASGQFILFVLVCLLTGAALGADLALPPAIQADVVDYDTWRTGSARAGLQFALWGMSTKFAMALAVGLALPSLSWLGFDPQAPSDAGNAALVVIYAVLPVVIKIAAVILVWRFPLDAAKHAIIRKRLARRMVTLSGSQ